MEQNQIQKNMWNEAGKAGLALGAVSTAYLFTTQFLAGAEIPAIITMLLTTVLWAAKFGGCIWIMMFFMKRFAAENPEADNRGTRRLGVIAALLSAILFAAACYANVAFFSSEILAGQFEATMQQMAPMMDSNSLAVIDMYMENLPEITFITYLIYCFIFGAVLSAILSMNIPSKDPFADYKPDEQ